MSSEKEQALSSEEQVIETTEEKETLLQNEINEEKTPSFLRKIKQIQTNMVTSSKENEVSLSEPILEEIIRENEDDTQKESISSDTDEKAITGEENEMMNTCEALRALKIHLMSAPTPLLKKDYVMVHRNDTLALVDTLVSLCNENPFEDAILGDGLLNKLSGSGNEETAGEEPLSLVKNRVQTILNGAMAQADLILNDAKILSHQLLSNTEKKIQARYDEAEKEISSRIALTREESNKKLTEAKDSLNQARQQSEEILKKYLDKAEDDYQGYWERAEKHLEASHEKSLSILNRALDIYNKELNAIREDMMTLDDILRELSMNRPRKK